MDSGDLPLGNETRFSSLTGDVTLMRASFTDHAFERHSHDCFSIGVTTFGTQTFQCRGKRHESRVGDLVLLNPDEDHDGHGGTPEGFRYAIWYVPTTFLRNCMDRDAGSAGSPYFAAPHVTDHRLSAAFLARTQEILQHPSESLQAESIVGVFLERLLARHGERAQAASMQARDVGRERLLRVKDYIRTYFRHDLTIAELATVAGLSRAHLTRAFGATFHVPPHVYLNSIRIAHAQALIGTGMPLAEVAVECGFADQSHLTRRFKRSVGTTPAEWSHMRSHSMHKYR